MKEKLKILLLASIGIFLALICIIWSFNLRQKPGEIRRIFPRQEKETVLPEAILSFSPQELTKFQGESFTVNILIKSKREIGAADLYLSYDNLVLELEKINPGKFFPEPKELSKKIDKDKGKVFYALGSFTPKAGEGVLVSLTFKGKAVGKEAQISLEESTQIAANNGDWVSLELSEPGKYSILKSVK